MKKAFSLIFGVMLIMGLAACTDENIGQSITDISSQIIEDSSFTITGHSVRNSKIQARTSTQLVGRFNSPGYGSLSSDVVCQWMPSAVIDTAGTRQDWIDSCRLVLRIPTDGFTGDSLAPMRLNVYGLNRQLTSPIYSDFNPAGYYGDLLGTTSYSPKSATRVTGYTSNYTYYSYLEVRVPMPVNYARSMYALYKQQPAVFCDPAAFKQHFPGIYISNSYGSGRVMNFYATELEVYYRQHVTLSDTTDTVYRQVQSYVGSTPEVISNNNIVLNPDPAVQQMVDAGDAVVMGPAGYEVQVRFPIQEIIDEYRATTRGNLGVLNSLSMEIPVEAISNKYGIDPPEYLLMVKRGLKDQFFAGDSLTNSKDSFYAKYNSATRKYTFSGMRDYILNILNNENGVATDDDINMTITPIDVETYTNNTSSYYYYNQNSTVVTKISPSVSVPCLAKLRLDKAKIKIVFSQQKMN